MGNAICLGESLIPQVRLNIRNLQSDFDKTEEDMKALQSVGQIIGEILKQLDDERCEMALSPYSEP